MAARLQRDGDVFIAAVRDIHGWLYPEVDTARLSAHLSIGGAVSFPIAELRAALQRDRLPRRRARDASRIDVGLSVKAGLLSDSTVTLGQIFIEPRATAASSTKCACSPPAARAWLTGTARRTSRR